MDQDSPLAQLRRDTAAHSESMESRTRSRNPDAILDASPDRHPKAAGPEQIDRFRLGSLLGQGGMGQVWEAWDPQLERPVAIKRLLTGILSSNARSRSNVC